MIDRVIQIVRGKLAEERSKFIEYTRQRQYDIALIHSARIDTLYWVLKILESIKEVKTKNE